MVRTSNKQQTTVASMQKHVEAQVSQAHSAKIATATTTKVEAKQQQPKQAPVFFGPANQVGQSKQAPIFFGPANRENAWTSSQPTPKPLMAQPKQQMVVQPTSVQKATPVQMSPQQKAQQTKLTQKQAPVMTSQTKKNLQMKQKAMSSPAAKVKHLARQQSRQQLASQPAREDYLMPLIFTESAQWTKACKPAPMRAFKPTNMMASHLKMRLIKSNSPAAKAKRQMRAHRNQTPMEDNFTPSMFAEPAQWTKACKPSQPRAKYVDPIMAKMDECMPFLFSMFNEPTNWVKQPMMASKPMVAAAPAKPTSGKQQQQMSKGGKGGKGPSRAGTPHQ